MTRRTFYAYAHEAPPELPPAPGPWDSDAPYHIKWGYDMDTVARLSRIAVSRCRTSYLPYLDAYEAAWSAIAETLCTASAYPEEWELLNAGWDAVNATASRLRRWRGIDDYADPMPRFAQYWASATISSHEGHIVEVMALRQILPMLSDEQRRAVSALAATGTTAAAAAAVGKTAAQFRSLIYDARKRFLSWWYEGEPAPGLWRAAQPSLTSRLTESEVDEMRARYYSGERQRAIAADLGISQGQVSALINGRIKPAPDPVDAA